MQELLSPGCVFSSVLPIILVAQLAKNLPEMWETWVQSLGWEDPLGKGTDTHSSIQAWRIPWTVQSMRSQSLWTCGQMAASPREVQRQGPGMSILTFSLPL